MKKNQTTVIVAIACAVIFFFIGMSFGKGSAAPAAGARGNFAGAVGSSTRGGFGGRGGAGGGFVTGQIVSAGNGTMVVQMPNGNSTNVFFSGTTQIVKPQPALASALTPGTMVMVGGTTNSDGSVTAATIQIRNSLIGGRQTASSTVGFGGRGQ
jgi:hypothetical protein